MKKLLALLAVFLLTVAPVLADSTFPTGFPGGGGSGGGGSVTGVTGSNGVTSSGGTAPNLTLSPIATDKVLGNISGSTTAPTAQSVQSSMFGSNTLDIQHGGTGNSTGYVVGTLGDRQNPLYEAHYRKAIADVVNGTGNAKIAFAGDSTTHGGQENANGDAYKTSAPTRFAQMLREHGLNVSEGVLTADFMLSDSRFTLGTNWTSSGGAGFGSRYINIPVAGSTGATYAPGYTIDTIIFYSLGNPGKGTVTITLDGGTAVGTINSGAVGAADWIKTTFTVAKGVHTINISAPTGSDYSIFGIEAYDSTTPSVRISNLGVNGAATPQWNGSGSWDSFRFWQLQPQDLTVVNMTINDINSAVPAATWVTAIQPIINYTLVAGDCLLATGNPISSSQALGVQYSTAANSVAVANSIGLVDIFTRWVSYAYSNPLGYYNDSIHPKNLGYTDIAEAYFAALPTVGVIVAPTLNKVAGSAGQFYWVETGQANLPKKITISFSGYTNASTSVLTFPLAFTQTPSVTGNGTSLTPTSLSTTGVTIPTSTTQSGTIVIEGI